MTDVLSRIALAIGASLELSVLVKATVVLVVAILAARMASAARASLRHALLASAFGIILVLPVLTIALPGVDVPVANGDAPLALPQATTGGGLERSGQGGAGPLPADPQSDLRVSVSVLLSAWTLGAGLFLAPLAVALVRLRRIRRSGLPWLEIRPFVNELATEAGVHGQLDVLRHEDIQVPMTCGFVRPTILLPVDAERWTDADRRHALVHELEHIRRGDWIVQLVARVACSLYWFHPLAWMAWRQMTLDAEHACDDAVVQRTDGTIYAHQLVTLAWGLSARTAMPGISMASRSDLTARVSAILNQDQARGRVGIAPMRAIIGVAMVIALTVSVLRAVQEPTAAPPSPFIPAVVGAKPAFDVASIKESKRDASEGCGRYPYPTRVEFINCTVESTIVITYRMQRGQLVGAPDWLASKRFDIIATSETPFAPQEGLGLVRQLLADRFNLKMRIETQPRPIYALGFARSDKKFGPHLRVNAICTAIAAAVDRGEKPPKPSPCRAELKRAPGSFVVRGNKLGLIVRNEFPYLVDRPVVDETGLTDNFDFELTFAPMALAGSPDDPVRDDRPSIFTALEEQLGLKLVPATRPVGVMVIDGVEPPTEN